MSANTEQDTVGTDETVQITTDANETSKSDEHVAAVQSPLNSQAQQYVAGHAAADTVYMSPGAYYTSYLSPNADAWSPGDPNSYYPSYVSPGGAGGVYADYAATQTAGGYGWLPASVDYSSWALGIGDAGTAAIYAPDGYYTVETYANGDIDPAAAGDMTAQMRGLDDAMKAMSVSELQPIPSPGHKTWTVVAGQMPAAAAAAASGGNPRNRKIPPAAVGLYQSPGEMYHPWNSYGRYPPGMVYERPPQLPYRIGRLNGLSSGKSGAGNAVVQQLQAQHDYNPQEFDLNPTSARFFVIKSYSEEDVHRSIKYSIWCSTEYGNKRLDAAYREFEGQGPVYLLFSVNGSGHFCGMAEMLSPVDFQSSPGVWAQDKWKGQFKVKWIYVKDIPNSQLRHIRLENNEGKPVTNSRDTQEVPIDKGRLVLSIIHHYRHATSIFDDFSHYEKCQEESRVLSPSGASVPH